MSSKLGNALTLFKNVIQEFQVGPLFTPGLLHNFNQVKVKGLCRTEWTLHRKKIFPSH